MRVLTVIVGAVYQPTHQTIETTLSDQEDIVLALLLVSYNIVFVSVTSSLP